MISDTQKGLYDEENFITEEFIQKMYNDQNGICKLCLNPSLKFQLIELTTIMDTQKIIFS